MEIVKGTLGLPETYSKLIYC